MKWLDMKVIGFDAGAGTVGAPGDESDNPDEKKM